MKEYFEVKLLRLKNGEDIIAFCYEDQKEKKLYVKYPKSFYFGYDSDSDGVNDQKLMLTDWIPKEAYAIQEVSFKLSNVLFTSYANLEFGHFYLKEVVDSLDPESDAAKKIIDTIKDMMIDEDIPENIVIH